LLSCPSWVVDFENVLTGLGPYLGVFDLAADTAGNIYAAGVGVGLDRFKITPHGSATVVKIASQGTPVSVVPGSITDSTLFEPGLPQGGGLATAFVSGLSGLSGTLVANSIPLPFTLGGVSVRVNGESAPILAVAAPEGGIQQINFQVPFDQVGEINMTFRVEINYNGTSTFTGAKPLPPSLIEYAGGSGAVQHASDSSLVTSSNPIIPGEIIVIYGTGFGPVEPAAVSGFPFATPAMANVNSVFVGGENCPILYAGALPGSVGGYQINCQTKYRPPASGAVQTSLYLTQTNLFLGSPPAEPLWFSNPLLVWTK
jgi:uncharacterized protein (TIGR03437 family)